MSTQAPPSATDLTVRLSPRGSSQYVLIAETARGQLRRELAVTGDHLRQFLEHVRRQLQTLVDDWPYSFRSDAEKLSALRCIYDIGLSVWDLMLGGQANDFLELLEQELPATPFLNIQVSVPGDIPLPFEIMPVRPSRQLAPGEHLRATLPAFLGPINQVAFRPTQSQRISQSHAIVLKDAVPTMFLRHRNRKLMAEKAYEDLLLTGYFNLLGPYPNDEWDGVDDITTLLYKPQDRDSTGKLVRAEIVHVHSHARVDEKAGGHGEVEAQLVFRHNKEFALTVERLSGAEGAFRPVRSDGPLAFINACEFAGAAYGSLNFSSVLITKAKYRAVIGPRVEVMVGIAREMSRRFYENFLAGGRTAAHALYEARIGVLGLLRNPVGALYTLFGDSDLRVTRH